MPRTRRPAPQAAATESAPTTEATNDLSAPATVATGPETAPLSPSADNVSAPAPVRRGRPRKQEQPASLTDAAPAETSAAAPVKRPGGRRKAADAVPDAAPQPPILEEPEPAKPARRRGQRAAAPAEPAETPAAEPAKNRGRRRATPASPVPDAPPVVAETPDVEAPVVAETPVDAPARSSRRRGGRGGRSATPAETTPSADAAGSDTPAPDALPSGRRRRSRGGRNTETAPVANAETADVTPAASIETPDVPPAAADTPAPPARRRGRRTSGQAAGTAEEAPSPAPPPSERERGDNTLTPPELGAGGPAPAPETATRTPNVPPPLRRRGRQRAGEETSSAPAEAPVELLAPVVDSDAEPDTDAADTEDAGERRGRRGRRSRRRRGDVNENVPESGEDTLLVGAEPVAVIDVEAEEEEAAELPPLPSVPVFVAPLLVPPAQAPAAAALLPRVSARLDTSGPGLAKIVVNDQPHLPFVFFVNTEEATDGATVDRELAGAASAGVHLYSGVVYLPLANAYGNRSFGAADAFVQQVLAADPDAFIIPRLQCVPTNFWARTHEDQMATYADGTGGDVSMASSAFWADCVDAIDALIAHFADPATPGGDRVIGFHLDRGEWFYDAAAGYDVSEVNRAAFGNYLHAKYQQPYRLRAAWVQNAADFDGAAPPAWTPPPAKYDPSPLYSAPRDGRWPDYHLFASDLVAQAITGLAEAVKVLSGGRLLVAVSYGYTLEFAGRPDSGHLALGKILDSPHIDILAGPNSYTGRGAGSASAWGAPVDSIPLHGKLWLVEDDTKTFLASAETPDTYNPKIEAGADTQAAHQRAFGAALAHKAGVSWMDLWGQGWLDSPDIWAELGLLTRQAGRTDTLSGPSSPDVAVFVDEASLAYMKAGASGLGQTLVGKTRELLLKTGASVGFYLQSDVLSENVPDAKLYLFLNALRLTNAERAAVQERLQVPGKTLAWLYAPGVFDENGLSETEASDAVGISLRAQPWNSRGGSVLTDAKHPVTERLRAARRGLGTEETVNPSYAVSDPEATVLAEYAQGGGASLAVREHSGGWKSVFIGDPHLSSELLRGLFQYANIPIAGVQDDVTHLSDGVLLVHASFTGQRTLFLPRPATVYDVMEDRILATNTRSFRVFLRARTTRLFLWGEAGTVMTATGLAMPDAQALEQPAAEPAAPPVPVVPIQDAENESIGFTVVALDDETIAVIETAEDGDAGDDSDPENAEGGEAGALEGGSSARRSRWQRRRAALRARREAERHAREAGGSVPGGAGAPAEAASLVPDLPPRLSPSGLPDGGGEDAE